MIAPYFFSISPSKKPTPRRYGSRRRPLPLLLSLICTFALFGLLLFMSIMQSEVTPSNEKLVTVHLPYNYNVQGADGELGDNKNGEKLATSRQPHNRPKTLQHASPQLTIVQLPIDSSTLKSDEPQLEVLQPVSLPDLSYSGRTEPLPSGAAFGGGDGPAGGGSGFGSGSGTGVGRGGGIGQREGYPLVASWAPTMDHSRMKKFYPKSALEAGIEGEALLRCFVMREDRVRGCQVLHETPQGHGFGDAVLKAQRSMRIRVHDQMGRQVFNEWVMVRETFKMVSTDQRVAFADVNTPDFNGAQ